MKKSLLFFSCCAILLGLASRVHAQAFPDLTVTPVVIDEKAKPRDIVKESVTLKNTSNHVLEIYPSVNDISSVDGEKAFVRANNSDGLSNSLANWIELSRGVVELGPGEDKEVPFIIHINQNAIPNAYHAVISLTEGGTRAEADAKPPLESVTVNLEVQADIKELLQLSKFTTGNVYLSGDDILFNYQLQNIGNQDLLPKGQVHIYNRRGEEVATVDVNKESKTISPEQSSQLASVWSAANGFGRYKALLTVNYGSSQLATVQDTVFFWVIPWKQMLVLFVVSLLIIIVLAFQFHSWLERRHLYKFAHAGFLNEDTIKQIQDPALEAIHAPARALVPQQIGAVPEFQTKKRRFESFRRGTRNAQIEAALLPLQDTQKPHQSLKSVLHKDERNAPLGSAIDLKQLRAQAAQRPMEVVWEVPAPTKVEMNGHIISLKKPK